MTFELRISKWKENQVHTWRLLIFGIEIVCFLLRVHDELVNVVVFRAASNQLICGF